MTFKEIDEKLEYGIDLRRIVQRFKDGHEDPLNKEQVASLTNILQNQIMLMEGAIGWDTYKKNLMLNSRGDTDIEYIATVMYDHSEETPRTYYKKDNKCFFYKDLSDEIALEMIKKIYEVESDSTRKIIYGLDPKMAICDEYGIGYNKYFYSLYEYSVIANNTIPPENQNFLKSVFVNVSEKCKYAVLTCDNYNGDSKYNGHEEEINKYVVDNMEGIKEFFDVDDVDIEYL